MIYTCNVKKRFFFCARGIVAYATASQKKLLAQVWVNLAPSTRGCSGVDMLLDLLVGMFLARNRLCTGPKYEETKKDLFLIVTKGRKIGNR